VIIRTRLMPISSPKSIIVWFATLALLIGAGCAPVSQTPAPAPTPSHHKGVLEEGRWLYADGGVYWLNLAGYEPEWPLAEQDYVFGWQKKRLAARLWVLPVEYDIGWAAIDLAHRQGWLLDTPRRIGWQGRLAWDARVSDQVMAGRLRLLKTDQNILAVVALAPKNKAEAMLPELAAMIEGLRLLPPADVLHTVRHPDETLSVIAMWYTGTVRNWPLLQKHNKLSDPKLNLGQDVLIPAKLVWRWDPLPGWVVRDKQSLGPKAAPAKEGETRDKALELELLPAGPK
jgi:hypothetical protein